MQLKYAFLSLGEAEPQGLAQIRSSFESAKLARFVGHIGVEIGADGRLVPISLRGAVSANEARAGFAIHYNGHAQEIVARLRSMDLDFIICFAHQEIPIEVVEASRHGCWRFRFGAQAELALAGVDEVCRSEKTQQVVLERFSAGAEGGLERKVLKSGLFKLHARSLRFHRASLAEQCASWPVAVARELTALGRPSFTQPPIEVAPLNYPIRLKAFACLVLGSYARLKHFSQWAMRQFAFQRWNIGLVRMPIGQAVTQAMRGGEAVPGAFGAPLTSPWEISWLSQPGEFACVADPFPVIHDQRLYVFAEKYDYVAQNGSIHVFALNDQQNLEEHKTAIRFPFHLSYPCVVRVAGQVYAIFEALDSREISIYRCAKFPDLWQRVSTVTAGAAFADPTLFYRDDRWWVFATEYDRYSEGNSSLHAWYSDDGLAGPWMEHTQNPVKVDVSCSRSAGTPFVASGELYRPAQNCADYYGRSVCINRIENLSPTSFREIKAGEIFPGAGFGKGIHHVAGAGDWTVVDGREDFFSVKVGLLKIWRAGSLAVKKYFQKKTKRLSRKPSPRPYALPHTVCDLVSDKKI